jgi:hypothetical protein
MRQGRLAALPILTQADAADSGLVGRLAAGFFQGGRHGRPVLGDILPSAVLRGVDWEPGSTTVGSFAALNRGTT